jgi:hypothetical protein
MGLVYDIGGDDDFVSLRDTPEFPKVLARVARLQDLLKKVLDLLAQADKLADQVRVKVDAT